MTTFIYDVEPFSGDRYVENSQRVSGDAFTPCAICGKAVEDAKCETWGHVGNGGGDWIPDGETCDEGGDMYNFPIGSDCHRRHVIKEGRPS